MANQKEKLAKELSALTGLDETILLTKTLKDLSEMLEEVNSATAEEVTEEEAKEETEEEETEEEETEEEETEAEVGTKKETKKGKKKKAKNKPVKIVTKIRKENHDTRHDVIMLRNVRYLNRVYKQGEVLDNMDVKRYLVKMGYAE